MASELEGLLKEAERRGILNEALKDVDLGEEKVQARKPGVETVAQLPAGKPASGGDSERRDSEAYDPTLGEELTVTGGATAGAMRGAAFGARRGPVGALVGGIQGAVVGGGTVAAGNMGLRYFLDYQVPENPIGKIADEAASQGYQQAIAEAGLGVPAALLRPFARQVTPAGKRALDFLSDQFDKFSPTIEHQVGRIVKETGLPKHIVDDMAKIGLLPPQATQSRFQAIMYGISRGSVIGGTRPELLERTQGQLVKKVQGQLGDTFGKKLSLNDVGDAFMDAMAGNLESSQYLVTMAANKVEALAPNARVGLEYVTRGRAGENVPRSIRAIVEKTTAGKANVELAVARELRDGLASVAAKGSAEEAVAARALVKRVDSRIMKSLSGYSKDAKDAYRSMLTLEGGLAAQYNNEFIRGLVSSHGKDGPRKVAEKILHSGDPTLFKKVFDVVDEDTANSIRAGFAEALLSKGVLGDSLSADGLRAAMLSAKGVEKKGTTIRDVLGRDGEKTLNEFQNVLDQIESLKTQSKPGETAIKLFQMGAVAGTVASGFGLVDPEAMSWGNLLVLMGPEALSQVMTRPASARRLMRLMQTPSSKSRLVTSLAVRFGHDLNKINAEIDSHQKGGQIPRTSGPYQATAQDLMLHDPAGGI